MDAEFYLPYWKQGDDFDHYLEDRGNVGDALEAHARDMDYAAAKLRELRALCGSPAAMVELLTEHFYYQLPMRLKEAADRKEIVTAILNHPEAKAEIVAAIDDQKKA